MAKRDLTEELIAGQEPVSTLEEGYTHEEQLIGQFQQRMEVAYNYWRPNIQQSIDDVEFIHGNQWSQADRSKRDDEQRPYLTMNVLPRHINQVVGAAEKSKFAIRVIKKAGDAGYGQVAKEDGGSKTPLPYNEIMEGIIRDVEDRSNAGNEYCRALQDAVEGGFGWLRVRTMRFPDDPFNIEPVIEHIRDRYSVLFDPYAQKDDLSDAMWMCLSETLSHKEFEERYPDVSKDSPNWFGLSDSGRRNDFVSWWGDGMVRICEYYYKEPAQIEYVQLVHKTSRHEIISEPEEIAHLMPELMQMGYGEVGRTKIESYRVMVLRCTSNTILEEPQEWPGHHIPIVPVFGRKLWRKGHMDTISLIRNAKDPQRALNFWITAATERVGNSPKEPWLVTADMIAGYEDDYWGASKVSQSPILVWNGNDNSQHRPERLPGATMPTAEMHIVQQMQMTIMDVIGLHEANLGEASNETSGVAIRNRQQAGDTGTYEYVNSLAYSIRAVADILVNIIPKIYTNDRAKNIILPDDSTAVAYLHQTLKDKETGAEMTFGNINLSRYSCSVKVGPHANTQRQITLEMLSELFRNSPETLHKVEDLYFQLLDLPNERAYTKRLKRGLPPGVLSTEEQEELGIEPPQPTPAEQAEMAKAESATAVAQSKTEEAGIALETAKVEFEKTKIEAAAKVDIAKSNERKTKSEEVSAANEGVMEKKVEQMVKQEMAKILAKKPATQK